MSRLLVVALLLAAGCASFPWTDGRARAALSQADALARGGDYQRAIAAYDDFLARYPGFPAAARARETRDALVAILLFRAELGRVRGEVARLRDELKTRESDLAQREKDLGRVRQELAARELELAARQAEAERLRAEADRLRAEAERLRADAEKVRADIERLKQTDLELERRRR